MACQSPAASLRRAWPQLTLGFRTLVLPPTNWFYLATERIGSVLVSAPAFSVAACSHARKQSSFTHGTSSSRSLSGPLSSCPPLGFLVMRWSCLFCSVVSLSSVVAPLPGPSSVCPGTLLTPGCGSPVQLSCRSCMQALPSCKGGGHLSLSPLDKRLPS